MNSTCHISYGYREMKNLKSRKERKKEERTGMSEELKKLGEELEEWLRSTEEEGEGLTGCCGESTVATAVEAIGERL